MNSAPDSSTNIRVLVVDDSAFMRFTVSKHLNECPDIQVVGAARDGQAALDVIPSLAPDVISLDVEMPRLDGLATLRQVMDKFPRPVVMLSSLTKEGARETILALTWGAVDFVAKPDTRANIAVVMDELIAKIRQAAHARVRPVNQPKSPVRKRIPTTPKPKQKHIPHHRQWKKSDKIVVVGVSTGGPRALKTVLPNIPANLPATYLIVQHMPSGFTRSLAERLDSFSELSIQEAVSGSPMMIGKGYIAPGGKHMTINHRGRIELNQNTPIHGVRPAVDVTMSSVAQKYGKSAVGVILTGMGRDGTNGAALIHNAGGQIIAEDESTCVVWGMPRSVVEAGVADVVVPLPDVASAIENAINHNGA